MFRRRRLQKTDYRQRLALLKSGRPRLVVRRALGNIHVQVIRYERDGDVVVAESFSKELKKHGWLGHGGSVSSAYLTGMLAGMKARKAGISSAVADIGLQTSVKGGSLYAAVAGAKDAGLDVPAGKDALPDVKRVRGEHIAAYAAQLKKDAKKYQRQFSAYLKAGLDPEKLPEHFDDVKRSILGAHGTEMKSKREIIATADGANQSVSDNGDEEWEDAD
jgi:large subunit ribosomal protein L18